MLYKVFQAQTRDTLKGDWVDIVRKDLKDIGINDTFEEIAKKKEETFKKQVTKAGQIYTFRKLKNEKDRRSKGQNLKYNKFEMKKYLVNENFKSREAIFLFKIRTEMLDVRKNYEKQYINNMTCQVCHSHTDTQQSILTCSVLNTKPNKINYNDLFSEDLNIVVPALKQYQKLWSKREKNT